jgi:UDP-N-acetylmuramate dehydrogenase
MSIFSGFEEIVELDHPLAPHTWYRLGGPADYFIRPRSVRELKEIVRRCNENHVRIHVLGFGSNLLVSDAGVRVVIKLQGEFGRTQFEGPRSLPGRGRNSASSCWTASRRAFPASRV